ncbi:MAG: TldD/PmbA family protein [Sandaracinaceae bacterium]|nr:TldD/PmbA family protein [Sandaracinaceae bacterium]
MLAELRERAAHALELARRAGASDAWASASRSRGVEVEVRDGQIEKLQESTSRALSLRLYVDGRYGTFDTSDLRERELAGFVREAVAMTRALEPDPFRVIPDPALFEDRPAEDLELLDRSVLAIEADTRIAWCMEMSARARRHDRIVSATVSAGDSHSLVASASTNGFSGWHERTSISRGGNVTLQDEGDARPAGYHYVGGRHLADLPDAASVGDEALRQAARRLGATQGPTRRGLVVVEPRAAGRLVGLLLGPASARASASSAPSGAGASASACSRRACASPTTRSSRAPSARATTTARASARGASPIVEGGALRTIYVDTYYGRKIEAPPTTGGSSNLVIEPGTRPLDAIVADVREGLLVTGWLGGNSDATTGDFSLGLRGHLIEGGQVGAPVQEMNLTGNLLTLFAGLIEVGSDPWLYSSTRVPTLVFEDALFSGA